MECRQLRGGAGMLMRLAFYRQEMMMAQTRMEQEEKVERGWFWMYFYG